MPISKITGQSIQDGSIVVADLGITTFNTGTGNTLTLQANSATGLVIDVTGNTAIANSLSFSAAGARIRGDFSNATVANRVAFQTNTANTSTSIIALPNGTGVRSDIYAFNNSDPTNSSFISMQMRGTAAVGIIESGIFGTGTYLPLTMYTGGSERLRIDTSGNVGIGTNSPTSFVNQGTAIVGTAGGTQFFAGSTTDGMSVGAYTGGTYIQTNTDMILGTTAAYDIISRTNGTERMRILSTGNIGIGTASPSQRLHVAAGTILASNTSTNSARVAIAGNGSTVGTSAFELIQGSSSEAYVYNRANSFLVLGTNNTERMRISSTGVITTGSIVGINGGTPGTDFSLNLNASTGVNGGLLAWNSAQTISTVLYTTASDGRLGVREAFPLTFFTNNTDWMRITSGGIVGIGTNSPSADGKLDVVGGRIRQQDSGASAGMLFGQYDSSGIAHVTNQANAALWFGTNNLERMRIHSDGNVSIGSSNNGSKFHVYQTSSADLSVGFEAATAGYAVNLTLWGQNAAGSRYNNISCKYGTTEQWYIGGNGSDATIAFRTGSGSTERMRIDSGGNLRIGIATTIYSTERVSIQAGSAGGYGLTVSTETSGGFAPLLLRNNDGNATKNQIFFVHTNTIVGSVTSTTGGVSFNTTSDYRLKENITPMTGALDKVARLKPVTYKWKVDGSDGQGFIAHELQEVCPDAVVGEKDAVDAEGKPIHQGVDTSFLVATLTAAIKEQQAIIENLKSRIETLEKK